MKMDVDVCTKKKNTLVMLTRSCCFLSRVCGHGNARYIHISTVDYLKHLTSKRLVLAIARLCMALGMRADTKAD